MLSKSYGDITPKTDLGKLAVAAYAVIIINVVGGLLQPARTYLEALCRVSAATQPEDAAGEEKEEEEAQKEEDVGKENLPSSAAEQKASSPARAAKKIATGSYRTVESPKKER